MAEIETYAEKRNFLYRVFNKKKDIQDLILNSGLISRYLGGTEDKKEVFQIKGAFIYTTRREISILPEEGNDADQIKSKLENILKIKLVSTAA